MPLYESTFVARQDVSVQDVNKLTDQMSAVISSHGGKLVKSEYWGLRNLAYKIKKNRKGHYVMLALDAPADTVRELERQLKLNEDVIRALTVRVEEIEKSPSPVMMAASRSENEYQDT